MCTGTCKSYLFLRVHTVVTLSPTEAEFVAIAMGICGTVMQCRSMPEVMFLYGFGCWVYRG